MDARELPEDVNELARLLRRAVWQPRRDGSDSTVRGEDLPPGFQRDRLQPGRILVP